MLSDERERTFRQMFRALFCSILGGLPRFYHLQAVCVQRSDDCANGETGKELWYTAGLTKKEKTHERCKDIRNNGVVIQEF